MGENDANQRFAQEATIEPDHISRARAHALELGAAPISPAVIGALSIVGEGLLQLTTIVESRPGHTTAAGRTTGR